MPEIAELIAPSQRVLAIQRAFSVETTDGIIDALRLSALEPAGIFLGSAAEAQVRANAMNGTLDSYELSFEDGEKLRGRFLVQKLDYSGDFNGERNYTLQLESSGPVTGA